MKIHLIRHGMTVLKKENRYQGKIDEPLSQEGIEELIPVEENVREVYVTPLCRTLQTARILFPKAHYVMIDDLREMDFGAFEGRSAREMKNDPEYRVWVDGMCEGRCPGGETKGEFFDRTCRAFANLVDQALEQEQVDLYIVAHGGTQMAVMDSFVEEKKQYYAWLLDCGQGYLLETDRWKTDRTLTLLGTVDYTRAADP